MKNFLTSNSLIEEDLDFYWQEAGRIIKQKFLKLWLDGETKL